MKRKITKLEEKLINDGWCLTIKRYTGKGSNKVLCYEYHKTSDLRNDNKVYDQIIVLDQKRSQVVDYGIKNVCFDFVSDEEICLLRFLRLELKHFVERVDKEVNWNTNDNEPDKVVAVPNSELDEREELGAMTFEQFDELCQEKEKSDNEN